MYRFFAILSLFLLLFASCKERTKYGYVRLLFAHQWEDAPLQLDGKTEYVNAAGNVLTFNNLEYFISEMKLHRGNAIVPLEHPDIHYITNDTATTTMLLTYQIPIGDYTSISFKFGLSREKNKSGIFVNPPESNMFWPEDMGGGYHYMKIDGKWSNQGEPTNRGFGLHLGALNTIVGYDTTYKYDYIYEYSHTTGQKDSLIRIDTSYTTEPIYQHFHHDFAVSVQRNFTVRSNEITTVNQPIVMDVKMWMEQPYKWDFNKMGGEIMSRRWALDSLKSNGREGVFR